jgi:hypothetical protein
MTDRSTAERIALIGMKARLAGRAGPLASSALGIRAAFRELSLILHPDQPGGSRDAFERLVIAKDELLAAIARETELREGLMPAQTEAPERQRSLT